MNQTVKPTNYGALGTLVMVFFFWGFIAASNSILIPFCKTHFSLTQFESQLIGSAFYIAYFVGSLILFVVSNFIGTDIVNKIGYKRGIIYGLFISVIGALTDHSFSQCQFILCHPGLIVCCGSRFFTPANLRTTICHYTWRPCNRLTPA